LRAPVFNEGIARCTQQLIDAAEVLYRRAEHGIAELAADCRPAIQAARLVYAEIGHCLARDGLDPVNRRAVVSGGRKLALMSVAAGRALLSPRHALGDPAPLPAVRFLVDAAAPALPVVPRRRSFDERMQWAAELHARLAERDNHALR
jgi:phytoene synthase